MDTLDVIEDFSSDDLEVDSAFSVPTTQRDLSSSSASWHTAPTMGAQTPWAVIAANVVDDFVRQVQASSWAQWPKGALRPTDPLLVINVEEDPETVRPARHMCTGLHKRRRGTPAWERLTVQAMAAYRRAHPDDDSFQRAMEERTALETRRSVSPTRPFTYTGSVRLEGGPMCRPPRRLGGGSGRSGPSSGSTFRTPPTYRGGRLLPPGLPLSRAAAGARCQAGGAASRGACSSGATFRTPTTYRGGAPAAKPASAGGNGVDSQGSRRRQAQPTAALGAGLPRRRSGGSWRVTLPEEETDLDLDVSDFEGQPPVVAVSCAPLRRRRTLGHQMGIYGRQGDRIAWSCPRCPFATELVIAAGEVAKARANLSARRRGHLRRHHPEVTDELRVVPQQLAAEVRPFRQSSLMGWKCPICSWGLSSEDCEKFAEDVLWRAKRKHREDCHAELTAAGWRSAIQKRAWTVPRRCMARAQLLNEFVARELPQLREQVGSHQTVMFFWMDFGFTLGEHRQKCAKRPRSTGRSLPADGARNGSTGMYGGARVLRLSSAVMQASCQPRARRIMRYGTRRPFNFCRMSRRGSCCRMFRRPNAPGAQVCAPSSDVLPQARFLVLWGASRRSRRWCRRNDGLTDLRGAGWALF